MQVSVVCPKCHKINRIPQKDHYAKVNCGACKASLLHSKPTAVNTKAFNVFVANSSIPVVADFWATWCGPCRQMAPAFEEAALKMPLQAQFLKVNVDEESQLGARFGIRSIPTLIIFKDGKEVDRLSGAVSAGRLQNWVKQYIS